MNHYQLHKPDGTPVKLWQCQCGTVFSDEECAEKCCVCHYCGNTVGNNDFYGRRSYPIHTDCDYHRRREIYEKRLQEAEKLEFWDGYVYCDGVGYNDGYFPSIDELEEYLYDEYEPDDYPEFAFVCKPRPVLEDGDRIVDRILDSAICDNGWGDISEDDLAGVAEFRAACLEFSEKNKDVVSYYPDYTRATRVCEKTEKEQ